MELMGDGFVLLIAGMGTVFAFLVVMVCWVFVSSRFLSRFSHLLPEIAPSRPSRASARGGTASESVDQGELVAVISAAIQKYRSEHRW